MSPRTFAIVGASLAGGYAAHQLRKDGFDGRIVLIGAEPHLPYDRPPLSKGVLSGKVEPAATALWQEVDFSQAEIELRLATRAVGLRPQDRTLELAGGDQLQVDKLLLCTGVRPRRLPIPGLGLAGVHELRTIEDAVIIRDALAPGARVVVIGFGFIGAEVAAAAAERGCQVTLVETAPLPMQRVLGPEAGRRYVELHRAHGVEVRLGVQVAGIRGRERAEAVVLADGTELPADVIVCGVGATPAAELAEAAGIAAQNGILVDAQCRTSLAEVYACGDVAARPSAFAAGPIRLEAWQNAYRQGIAAAGSMLGSEAPFDDLPWFWSDQYDVKMQLAGLPSPTDEVVWRDDGPGCQGVAFYLSDQKLSGVLGFNRPREVRAAMDLIRKGIRVRPDELADRSVDLRALAAA